MERNQRTQVCIFKIKITITLIFFQGGIVRIDSKCFPVYMGVNTVGRNKSAVVNVKNLVGNHFEIVASLHFENVYIKLSLKDLLSIL